MPELTYEQKKALLGIDERFRPHQVAALIAVELSFGNIKEGRIWCITYGQDNFSSSDDFHSAINDEYLFTFDFEIQHTSSSDISECLVRSNENFAARKERSALRHPRRCYRRLHTRARVLRRAVAVDKRSG